MPSSGQCRYTAAQIVSDMFGQPKQVLSNTPKINKLIRDTLLIANISCESRSDLATTLISKKQLSFAPSQTDSNQ